jgi:hypothetical protein
MTIIIESWYLKKCIPPSENSLPDFGTKRKDSEEAEKRDILRRNLKPS